VACCDIVLANQNTKFCFAEVKLGLAPAIISPFVINAIGVKAAKRLMLTAEVFDTQHALQIGLIDDIITIETVELKLAELSALLLSNSSSAMTATKKLLLDLAFNYPQPIKDQTVNLIAELRTSTDTQTRLKQFLKRKK
jgi:methylglutaconyl-CoA hydratase